MAKKRLERVVKTLGMAAIALPFLAGVCAAQGSSPDLARLDQARQLLSAVTQKLGLNERAPGTRLVEATGSIPMSGTSGTSIPTGWNYFHATNCGWFSPDFTNNYFYIYPQEGGFYWELNNPTIATALALGCAHNNQMAVYVVDPSTGAFNETWSYPVP